MLRKELINLSCLLNWTEKPNKSFEKKIILKLTDENRPKEILIRFVEGCKKACISDQQDGRQRHNPDTASDAKTSKDEGANI